MGNSAKMNAKHFEAILWGKKQPIRSQKECKKYQNLEARRLKPKVVHAIQDQRKWWLNTVIEKNRSPLQETISPKLIYRAPQNV